MEERPAGCQCLRHQRQTALFVVTEGGGCRCGKGGDELKGLAKYKVADSPVWASPAVVGDQVLIKDKTNLTLFQFKG